jgi:polyribonucleotide nucleotidyltransferase
MREEIQIVASCLSLDERVPADVLGVTGASIATLLAGIPFYGPMAAVRVGLIGDDFILNPSYREIEKGDLDIVVAGSPEGIVMIEAGANQLSDQDTIEAIDFGYEAVTELIKAQENLLKDLGIKQVKPSEPEEDKSIATYLEKNCSKSIDQVLKKFDQSKDERDLELDKIELEVQSKINSLKDENQLKVLISENEKLIHSDFKKLTKKINEITNH